MNKKKTISRVLVFGGSGFIGSNFLRHFSRSTNFHVVAPTHYEVDILRKHSVEKIFHLFKPNAVINFAAHRNANTAEFQRGDKKSSAWKTNVDGVINIANVSSKAGSYYIHISTDMVFPGNEKRKGPYKESEVPERTAKLLSWYGWTKAVGEAYVTKQKNTAVIRIGNVTASVYDPTLDYVGKILYLFDERKLYPLFDDQQLTLTSIPVLLRVIGTLMKNRQPGVFHVASSNTFTPFELGTYLIYKVKNQKGIVKGVSIDSYLKEAPNRYPKYGGLLSMDTEMKLGITMPRWEVIVDDFIRALSFKK